MTTTTRTMTVAKAQDIATALSNDLSGVKLNDVPDLSDFGLSEDRIAGLVREFFDAVAHAVAEGWNVVDVTLTDDNILLSPHDGVVVAWFVPEYLANRLRVDNGEPEPHVTLCYLGKVDDLTLEQQRELVGLVAEVLEDQHQLYGIVSGTGSFPAKEDADEYPWFAGVNVPGLAELRQRLATKLEDAGFPVSTYPGGYTPHLTLAYIPEGDEPPQVDLAPEIVNIDSITVGIGGSRRNIDLPEPDYDENYWDERDRWMKEQLGEDYWSAAGLGFRPFVKSTVEAERRFTLGPWYIPDIEDAHGEWTDADTLQQALWGYVRSGYRTIHLQHEPSVAAGEWVELMQLPWAVEVPVIDPAGNVSAHILPKGTVMMGVVWEPWAWELVLDGSITGLSIGGQAMRLDEDPPADETQLQTGE